MVKVEFLGYSCFKIRGVDGSVIIDPYREKATGLDWNPRKADVVMVTKEEPTRDNVDGVKDLRYKISSPGEYEVQTISVVGIGINNTGELLTTAYQCTVDELRFLHLGGLDDVLDDSVLSVLTEIDVLFVPVGGGAVLDFEKAAKVVAQIEPKIVVPMHYQQGTEQLSNLASVDKFIEEMGEEKEQREVLKLKSRSALPEDTEVIVLG
ncbi:MAG: MBL fold metallo-hydrolase [Patescibacteria group bacterium]